MFREKLQVSRERLEFYYSIALLVLIPVLIVANTLIMSVAVRGDFNTELRRKAAMANTLLAESIKPNLDDTDSLQAQVDGFIKGSPELRAISIAAPADGQQFRVLASSDGKATGEMESDLQYLAASSSQKPIAKDMTLDDGERVWSVASPVLVDGAVAAVVVTDVSSEQADALIGNTLLQSLGIVCATVVLIVLLLLNHFKFVQYAMLFRKMKEVDQLKNDFLSVATHELRAPMTVIKGSIENLQDGITGTVDERGKQALAVVTGETDRLNNLVTDLLNVSRLEQGRITYTFETVDSRDVCSRLVGQFTAKAEKKGLSVTYEQPQDPALVSVDNGRLIEIMTNLIDNAIKYSRQGAVVVSHKDDAEKIRISVRDTGIGISAKDRERLFSRFYRVQNDSTHGIPGTGLGLWIIKQYIEAMHGTISVDSLEGVGTEFVIEFPRAAPAAADEKPGAASDGTPVQ